MRPPFIREGLVDPLFTYRAAGDRPDVQALAGVIDALGSWSLEIIPVFTEAHMKRVIPVVDEPRRIHEYVAYAQFVAERVAADPVFVSPRPPIAVLLADVAALGAATVGALSRTAGTKAVREALAVQVHSYLMTLKRYVREVADANAGEEAVIIARAGMSVKSSRGPSKPTFEAKQLPVSGAVHLFARAAKGRASYDWQYSKGEDAWFFGPPTVRADVTLDGLVRGAVYFFRYRTVTKEGVSDWSQVVSLLVV